MTHIPSFSELYSVDYHISHIFAMNQMWQDNSEFTMKHPRPTNALLLFDGCDAIFRNHKDNIEIYIPRETLFFIPFGSTYHWKFSNKENNRISTILFEFFLTDFQGNPVQIGSEPDFIKTNRFHIYQDLFSLLVAECSKPLPSVSKMKARAYSLLDAIIEEGKETHLLNGNLSCIHKGIRYLEEDERQEKSIAEVAAMCHVSVNYFERLFKEYANCTPTEYRLQKKIERAKLLLSNEMLNIQQIAMKLNFEDCAYFCRVFKKMCGCTPTAYRKASQSRTKGIFPPLL